MMRGQTDELEALLLYSKNIQPVQSVGFVTNDQWGFTIGYSPDGLVGDDGLVECKSRRQKFQVETIISGVIPEENRIQIQTALMVTGRRWCDYVSYCGGLPMTVIRMFPDRKVMDAIIEAATGFEGILSARQDQYNAALKSGAVFIPTERKVEQDMFV